MVKDAGTVPGPSSCPSSTTPSRSENDLPTNRSKASTHNCRQALRQRDRYSPHCTVRRPRRIRRKLDCSSRRPGADFADAETILVRGLGFVTRSAHVISSGVARARTRCSSPSPSPTTPRRLCNSCGPRSPRCRSDNAPVVLYAVIAWIRRQIHLLVAAGFSARLTSAT